VAAEKNNKYASFNNTQKLTKEYRKRDWIKEKITSYAGKRTIAKYNEFRMINESNTLTPDQTKELAQTFMPSSNMPEKNVKIFLKQDEVKQVADNRLIDVLTQKGITFDYIVDKRKQAIEGSQENKQFSAMIKGIEGFEELAGLRNKVKIVQKQTQNYDFGKHLPPGEGPKEIEPGNNSDKPPE